ncbi:MAG: histidine kinase [Clostridia bacterium]|nr:histidine kinase [Clostridia bacterium]
MLKELHWPQNSILRRIFLYIFVSTLIITLLFITAYSLETMRNLNDVAHSHAESIVETVATQMDAYVEEIEQAHTLFYTSEFVHPFIISKSVMPSYEWFEDYNGALMMLQFCLRSKYQLVSGMQLHKSNGETMSIGSFNISCAWLYELTGSHVSVRNGYAFYSSDMRNGPVTISLISQLNSALLDNLCTGLITDGFCLQLETADAEFFRSYGDAGIIREGQAPFAEAHTSHPDVLYVRLYAADSLSMRTLADEVLRWLPALLLALISGIVLSYIFSSRMSGGFRLMEHNIESVSCGKYGEVRVLETDDEFGRLSKTFANMAESIQTLLRENERQRRTQFDLEIQVLRAQVSPHFLYNALGSVHQLARMQGNENIAQLTTSIIRLLRAAIATSDELTPLSQEVENVANYYEICKYQYVDDITMDFNIQTEARDCMLPPMTLQPIVENAVIHGIGNYRPDGRISISAAITGDILGITITDNGRGMTTQQVADLLSQTRNVSRQRFSGIGLYNVRKRIEMRFGAPYGLDITSEPGEYTRVTLTLPVIRSRS